MEISAESARTAGILLIAIVTVEFGGWYMLRVVTGREQLTDFQRAFARAGHAHAGVLVTLGLVCQLFVDATDLSGLLRVLARSGVPLAAILMSAGFFFSSAGRGRTRPNRWIVLLYAGIAMLTLGVVSLGLGLLTT